ncbi:MAG: hypothetical protein ACSLFP_05475 [Acidimicrobiales bacterium]
MTHPLGDPTAVATAWMDRSWDDEASLLWNPAGAFDEVAPPRTVHLVRETGWYALGLLRRDAPGDRARAERALASVLDHQYDQPGSPWHGSFVRFPEWPAPRPGAIEWVDYDPNWRQFVGTALAVMLTDLPFPPSLAERARAAIALAVAGEPPDRVPPTYANIALLRAWLDVWSGHGDLAYAESVSAAFHRHGCFTEHNSPTYYGIDLLALGLWQRSDAPARLRELGAGIEQALWTDVGRWWHAGLGNLCGPFSRAYGMDLHRYVTGLSLALWVGDVVDDPPLPPLDADRIEHGHDLCVAPMLQHLGVRPPAAALAPFHRFPGPHLVQQEVDDAPDRLATGWLGDDVMLGAERHAYGPQARGQYHPATVHWRLPDGGVGWLRLVHHGPTEGEVTEGRLIASCRPHARRGPQPLRWESAVPPLDVSADRWTFPGLTLAATTDGTVTSVDGTVTVEPATGGSTTVALTVI